MIFFEDFRDKCIALMKDNLNDYIDAINTARSDSFNIGQISESNYIIDIPKREAYTKTPILFFTNSISGVNVAPQQNQQIVTVNITLAFTDQAEGSYERTSRQAMRYMMAIRNFFRETNLKGLFKPFVFDYVQLEEVDLQVKDDNLYTVMNLTVQANLT